MTLQQLRYAVEVAQAGSITKSAAKLFMSQPNLSAALRDLEEELGTTIFLRSSKGIAVTDEGEEFLTYARSVVAQVDRMEFIFKGQRSKMVTLSVASVHSSNVARLMCELYNRIAKTENIDLSLIETAGSPEVMDLVAAQKVDLGRFACSPLNFFQHREFARKNDMVIEILWKVRLCLLFSVSSPLAEREVITQEMLEEYTRVVYRDLRLDPVPRDNLGRQIAVSDRATAMDFLSCCPDSYLWTISTHPQIWQAYNLMARPCQGAPAIVEAVVYKRDRPRTKEMQWFMTQLKSAHYAEQFLCQEDFQTETLL